MEKIGKYEIIEKIGTGGFGVVFKGRDPFIKRFVAIKTCNSDSEDMRRRFFREAEIAGNLQHKNVTTVYDFGFEGEVPYLVQEYLPGEDLDKVMARRALSDGEKLDYLIQVAAGLAYAHEQGVIHRDIKPSNVRVADDGRIKIMDFGIAKLANQDSQLTKTGMTLGTASYLAPEQIRGDELTWAVDIFSFGVVAYELFAHRRPFEATSISSLFYRVLSVQPPPLRTVAPDCPPELAAIIERCLAKEPSDRWPSAGSLWLALEGMRDAYPRAGQGEIAERTERLPVGDYADPEGTVALSAAVAREELARVEARVTALLEAGNPTAAEIEVTIAQKRLSGTPGALGSLAPLHAHVSEERARRESERRRNDKVAGLLARGRELAQAGEHDEAAMVLRTALEVNPGHTEVVQLLAAVEEAATAEKQRLAEERERRAREEAAERERRERAEAEERERRALAEAEQMRRRELAEAEARRRRALAEAAAAVAARLGRGDLTGADGDLTRLEGEYGNVPELGGLRQELAQRRRDARVAALRQEAERCVAADDLPAALLALREARQLAPSDAELPRRSAELERVLEERRAAAARAAAIGEVVARVSAALSQRRWDEAAATLRQAARKLGDDPQLDRLRERLAAEQEAERQAREELRRARVAQLSGDAAQRRQSGDLAGSIAGLEEALRLGADPALQAQLAADRAALRLQQEAAARAAALEGVVARVSAALDQRHWDEAAASLRQAARKLGDDPQLERLRQRLAAEQAAERQAREDERRARVAQLSEDAAQRRQSGDLASSIAGLEEALRLGADPALQAQLAADRAALRREQEAAARQKRLAAAVAEAEAALAAGKPKAAARVLKRATHKLGSDAALASLAQRVETALRPAVVTPAVSPAGVEASSPGATRLNLRWVAAGGGALLLVVLLGLFWPQDEGPRPPGDTLGGSAVEAGEAAGALTHSSPAVVPSPAVALPTPAASPELQPSLVVPQPSPAPTAGPSPKDEAAARAAAAVGRARSALAARNPARALREAAVAQEAAPGDLGVTGLLDEILRTARGAAGSAAARAARAKAGELAPRELAAAVAKRRSAEAAASSRPLDAARALWESVPLYEQASAAARAEGERIRLAQQGGPAQSIPIQTPVLVQTPVPQSTAADETAAILAALDRYARAYESLDAGAVQAVWPSAPLRRLQESFLDYSSLQMSVTGCDVQQRTDTATATCRRRQEVKLKVGRTQPPIDQQVRFRLHKVDGGWIIAGIDAQR